MKTIRMGSRKSFIGVTKGTKSDSDTLGGDFFKSLLDGIDEPLLYLSPDLTIHWANRCTTEKRRGKAQNIIGEKCSDIGCCEDTWCLECPVIRAFEIGQNQSSTHTTSEGLTLEIRTFLTKAVGQTPFIIRMERDITAEVELNRRIEYGKRLESLGVLTAGLAHEINNPISLILLNVPLVREAFSVIHERKGRHKEIVVSDETRISKLKAYLPDALNSIDEGSKRIKNLVDDLKKFASRGGGKQIDKFDLNDAVQSAIESAAIPIKNATANFRTNYTNDLPLVGGSFHRISQAILNLIMNACQALENPTKSIFVTTGFDSEKNMNVVTVKDEGIGIDEEILPKIVDPLFTTRREEGRAGLGLSIAERIVREHGGRLEFSTEQGVGTTVALSLPVTPPRMIYPQP